MNEKPIVHVTQVGGCQRKKYHEIIDKGKELPPHFYGVKGTMCHKVLEKSIEQIEVPKEDVYIDLEYPALISGRGDRTEEISRDVYEACMPEVEKLIETSNEWLETQEYELQTFISEDTMNVETEECIIRGTPDLYDNNTLIDFKSGKPMLRSDYIRQAAAYKWMLKKEKDVDIKECHLIFLGGDKPVDKLIPEDKLSEGYTNFQNDLRTHLDTIEKVKIVGIEGKHEFKCSNDFACVFCKYRHLCSGV